MNELLIYCANCKKEVSHSITKDHANEYIAACGVCNRILKFLQFPTAEQLEMHKITNTIQC